MGDDRARGFAARPRDADAWVGTTDRGPAARGDIFTARLTIDVTPALRARIKIAAFAEGRTVTDMLRAMLEERFPETSG